MLTSLDPTPFADPSLNTPATAVPLPVHPLQQARWLLCNTATPPSNELLTLANQYSPHGGRLLAQLLHQRGLSQVESALSFLDLAHYTPTSGLELPDAEVGLARIVTAIDQQQPILVYGDFDVDGQTGTSVLMHTLKALGARVSYYIPDRSSEGHGLHSAALCKLVSTRQTQLVITTDTGITNFNEVSLLNGLGVDTVITDHHDLAEHLPPAIANINPKRLNDSQHPLYHLCGAGVALKLCELLLDQYDADPSLMETLYGIAAIGTVVDMMPLVKENRWLVWRGLQSLNQRSVSAPCTGIDALLAVTNTPKDKPISSETLGFSIGPRLNALGRLERADAGVTLLTTSNPTEAESIAKHLDALNRQRQAMCEDTLLQAEQALAKRGGLDGEKAIALASPDWHAGIIGLAATRLKDRYNVPVFLMIVDEANGLIKGSARGIDGFNIHSALTHCAQWFTHYGGHAGAGGFAVPIGHFDAFRNELLAYCRNALSDALERPTLTLDAELHWDQLHLGLLEMTQALAPYGQANRAPLFMTQPLQVKAAKPLGDRNQHLKLMVAPTQHPQADPIDALLWQRAEEYPVRPGQTVQLVVTPERNLFNGTERLQLIVSDLGLVDDKRSASAVLPSSVATSPLGPSPRPEPSKNLNLSAKAPLLTPRGGCLWLDHRPREAVDSLVAQLMQPHDGQEQALLFHEAPTPPDIPFMSADQWITRATLRTAERLILWDLPPSAAILHQLIRTIQPSRIHLVGAVWQQGGQYTHGEGACLHQPVDEWLRGAYRHLKNTVPPLTNNPFTLQSTHLATQWGVTPDLVLATLSLLGRMELITWQSSTTETDITLHLELKHPSQKLALTDFPEYALLQQLWQPIRSYRQWLLTAPLQDIERQAAVPY
ncbi:MAG: single-stranded-DNA-specific exonuclease RecJ [Vampirovibrionales bacterium]